MNNNRQKSEKPQFSEITSPTHQHGHGLAPDTRFLTTARGINAVQRSFLALVLTALVQLIVVHFSGSVALLADTIHNFADAATAIPLWVAFRISRRPPDKKYSYGYGRFEDLAGLIILIIIFLSACLAVYQAIERLIHPQPILYLRAITFASFIGFVGNEAVAIFRIRVGKEIGSAALIADGYHARIDGLTSLAVIPGVIGIWMGYPIADPIIGLAIVAILLHILWQSSKLVFLRLMDGADPEFLEEVRKVACNLQGIQEVTEIRIRWLGHRLHAEINVAVSPDITVESAHRLADELRHELMHHLKYLSSVTIHVDPITASGEQFHRIHNHTHDNLKLHSH